MQFNDLINDIKKNSLDMASKSIEKVGLEILKLSSKEVPLDTGKLMFSGMVDTAPKTPKGTVDVGYHTPYALRLHEHPEYKFQRGRKGKYLEDPIKSNLSRFQKICGENFSYEIRTRYNT